MTRVACIGADHPVQPGKPRERIWPSAGDHMSPSDDPHLAGLETTVVPENWSGSLEVRSALDGQATNAGVERYRALDGRHPVPVEAGEADDNVIWLQVETRTSRVRIAQAARTQVIRDGQAVSVERRTVPEEPGRIA
jgi:alpha,alpha-trehalase